MKKKKSATIKEQECGHRGARDHIDGRTRKRTWHKHKYPSPPPFPGTDDQGSVATEAHTSHGDTYQWGTNKVTETRINATEDKKTKQNKTDLSEIIIYNLIEPRQGNYT